MAVEVISFGCRLNAAEGETMRRLAAEGGMEDALVINSCAVTGEAVRQTRQTIRAQHRLHPERPIIVTGCAAQTEPESFAAMPEVSRLIGNAEKLEAGTWNRRSLADFGVSGAERATISDIMGVRAHASHLAEAFDGQTRAFLEVQNGCDHRCTFCIIPYGRGPSRSVAPGAVVDAVKRLVDRGFAELVLTGVDLTSYGPDLPGAPTLGKLVKTILRHVPDLPRLRLSSIDSIEADPDLIEAMGSEKRLMPHLHLSLQSGSDLILKRMKRRHLSSDAARFCDTIRSVRPEIVFGADFIAGFPTETEADALETHAHVRACGLTYLHVFPYSARKGTPAAKMPPVPGNLIKERAQGLRALGARQLEAHLAARVGRMARVLSERGGTGRLEDFTPVALPSQLPHGLVFDVLITGHDGKRLTGLPVDERTDLAAE